MGLKIYDLLPDYRDRCPVCKGADCAVRHGLYFRRVVDREGHVYEAFGVPRFLCRRRGPRRSRPVTFSVLPAVLVPRRRFSLALLRRIVLLVGEGTRRLGRVLDELAAADQGGCDALMFEEGVLRRSLRVFAAVYARLHSFPLKGLTLEAGLKTVRSQAVEVARRLEEFEPRGSPSRGVLDFHRLHFPQLLFDVRLSAQGRPASS